ncbi:excalibur calcium-binding domain-containing protein [Cellulosimicrobium funkei]|uniref:excalibur calcium-binding domain-containing protein n=1 Tax=Cellulosimicrobium funkei TaxID=264251 RepID=UPI00341BEA29
MKMWQRATAAVATVGLGLAVAVSAAVPASARWVPDGYYLTKYTGEIWHVDSGTGEIYPITYDEWRNAGFPSPKAAPTNYVKYSWAPSIHAVTFFDPADPNVWLWDELSFADWSRAGKPAPRNAGWIEGSYVYKWGTSAEILIEEPNGGVNHKLTYNEWRDTGFKPYVNRANEGFVKYSWDSTIVRLTNISAGQGYRLSYGEWQAEGFPTPQVVNRVNGDQVYQNYGSPTLYYAGPGLNRAINYAEWTAMGQPRPIVYGAPGRPSFDKDCKDYPSQAAAQAEYRHYYSLYGDVFGLDADNDGIACESYFG